MKHLHVFLLLIPLTVGALVSSSQSYVYKTNEYCLTKYTSQPVYTATMGRRDIDVLGNTTSSSCLIKYTSGLQRSVNTTTSTLFLDVVTWTRTVTSTPSITVTPSASSTLITSTSNTLVTATATASIATTTTSSTITDTTTVSTTLTTTDTITITSTVTSMVSSTTTVDNAVPIASVDTVQSHGGADEYNNADPKRRRSNAGQKRKRLSRGRTPRPGGEASPFGRGKDEPASVSCFKNVESYTIITRTQTAAHTSTYTAQAPPASTSVTTVLRAATTIITPASTTLTASATATTTSTIYSTINSTVVTTTTETTTSPTFLPVQTSYAACVPNNIIDGVGGNRITGFSGNWHNLGSINSVQSCCVACQAGVMCAGFAFSLNGYYNCMLIASDYCSSKPSCNPSSEAWVFYDVDTPYDLVVGDGPCGQGFWSSN